MQPWESRMSYIVNNIFDFMLNFFTSFPSLMPNLLNSFPNFSRSPLNPPLNSISSITNFFPNLLSSPFNPLSNILKFLRCFPYIFFYLILKLSFRWWCSSIVSGHSVLGIDNTIDFLPCS